MQIKAGRKVMVNLGLNMVDGEAVLNISCRRRAVALKIFLQNVSKLFAWFVCFGVICFAQLCAFQILLLTLLDQAPGPTSPRATADTASVCSQTGEAH